MEDKKRKRKLITHTQRAVIKYDAYDDEEMCETIPF